MKEVLTDKEFLDMGEYLVNQVKEFDRLVSTSQTKKGQVYPVATDFDTAEVVNESPNQNVCSQISKY